MRTSLQAIAQKAASQKQYRFRNLYGMLNEEFLLLCWRDIRKDAACGVDRMSAGEYEENLEEHIRDLVERLKSRSYRAKLVRRQYIPKGDGKLRPLGIIAVEDKLLQLAVAKLLSAIYEQDFLRCSYGYRPDIGALDAVDKLTIKLQFGKYQRVVEADIKNYFGTISHEWLERMLRERIDDGALLWLIKKWLKAGVLERDGQVLHPETGVPQGGSVSAVLANIYLHYALDLWFHRVVKPQCRGEAFLLRYADDFVCGFEHQEEARRFYNMLGERLRKFKLELSAEKTRVIQFSQHLPESESFDFLGFEYRWDKDRSGKRQVKRRTSRRKLWKAVERLTAWCRENRHLRLSEQIERLNAKLRGHYQYYGVNGNGKSLNNFFYSAIRIHQKWLNRRGQRKSYNIAGYKEVLKQFRIARPRITGRPQARDRMQMARA